MLWSLTCALSDKLVHCYSYVALCWSSAVAFLASAANVITLLYLEPLITWLNVDYFGTIFCMRWDRRVDGHQDLHFLVELNDLLYNWLGVPCGSLKIFTDILMRSKTSSLEKMKQNCHWKFVRCSDIGWDISDQNYLKDTISLNKMMSFLL